MYTSLVNIKNNHWYDIYIYSHASKRLTEMIPAALSKTVHNLSPQPTLLSVPLMHRQ